MWNEFSDCCCRVDFIRVWFGCSIRRIPRSAFCKCIAADRLGMQITLYLTQYSLINSEKNTRKSISLVNIQKNVRLLDNICSKIRNTALPILSTKPGLPCDLYPSKRQLRLLHAEYLVGSRLWDANYYGVRSWIDALSKNRGCGEREESIGQRQRSGSEAVSAGLPGNSEAGMDGLSYPQKDWVF